MAPSDTEVVDSHRMLAAKAEMREQDLRDGECVEFIENHR
jgi:hypothetical protein